MATISVIPTLPHNKDGLVVVQVQSSKISEVRVPEGVTLDLSIKRPREGDSYSDPPPIKHAQPPPPPPGAMYRTPPTQIHDTNTFYSPQVITRSIFFFFLSNLHKISNWFSVC